MITLKNKKAINTYETILILKPDQTEEDTVKSNCQVADSNPYIEIRVI